jgi:hypothetical protein
MPLTFNILPPPLQTQTFCFVFRVKYLLKFWFYVFFLSVLCRPQFLFYGTTKFIFWLGKNKFDRIVPPQ